MTSPITDPTPSPPGSTDTTTPTSVVTTTSPPPSTSTPSPTTPPATTSTVTVAVTPTTIPGTAAHRNAISTPRTTVQRSTTARSRQAHAPVHHATTTAPTTTFTTLPPTPQATNTGTVVAVPQPVLPHVPAAVLPASWLGLAIGFVLILNGVFVVYLVSILLPFLRHRPRPAGDPSGFDWHFLVPCRDEEAVIGTTIAYLTTNFPIAHVWVIDDDSDDATASIVESHATRSTRVHLVQRRRPNARTGKSDALNGAYRLLSRSLSPGADRSRIVLCVVDADGRPAPGCLDVVAADHLFGRPETGAVQIEVRMINRDDPRPVPQRGRVGNWFGRLLVRLQDMEFRAVVSAAQLSRRWVHTVAMGGNGQFMRLSVLDDIAGEDGRPWRGSLQEDFEIGLHALFTGAQTEYTPDTWVDQEALPRLRPLLRQRARWSQGMMQCIRYLRQIWGSRHIGTAGVLEITYCLFQPWVQLIATLLFPLPWVLLVLNYVRHPVLASQFGASGGWTLLVLYVTCALCQLAIWGLGYWRRCERGIGFWRAIGFGVAFAVLGYVSYAATWRALGRIVRRRHGWAKTRRNAELVAVVPAVTAEVVTAESAPDQVHTPV